jgi:hypothetical protein
MPPTWEVRLNSYEKMMKRYKPKLTAESITFIRRSLREGVPLARLAALFGLPRSTIWRIERDHPWKHIPLGAEIPS